MKVYSERPVYFVVVSACFVNSLNIDAFSLDTFVVAAVVIVVVGVDSSVMGKSVFFWSIVVAGDWFVGTAEAVPKITSNNW